MGNGLCSSCTLDTIGGLYRDHKVQGTHGLAGTRLIADGGSNGLITVIGTHDGEQFWNITGQIVDRPSGKLVLDFSSMGGPSELAATYDKVDAKIRFDDHKKTDWDAINEMPITGSHKSGIEGDVGGAYVDSFQFSNVGVKGIRYVSAHRSRAPVDEITIVGTEDGLDYWARSGRYVDKEAGTFIMGETNGTFDKNRIKLQDEQNSEWNKI